MNNEIVWCITGAGHKLRECIEYVRKIKARKEKPKITAVFSGAGLEVARIYGLLDEIKKISDETVYEEDQGYSAPFSGCFASGRCGRVYVMPCTANTVAKIVYGIADTLVTNIVAHALKSNVEVVVFPTDSLRKTWSQIAVSIDSAKCRQCNICPPAVKCPGDAFYFKERWRIRLLKCIGCKKCVGYCKYGVVSFGRMIKVKCREIDINNVEKLGEIRGVKVIKNVGSDV